MADADAGRTPAVPLSAHARKNWLLWQSASDSYEREHAAALSGVHAAAWGLWRIPESTLQVLDPVEGRDVLELGCGAARWSIELARRGARVVGLDFSPQQLAHARRLVREAGVTVSLVEASAEAVPFPDASFDLVFCDWGAMTFCDPALTVPEVGRLLRSGGQCAFATGSPFGVVCQDLQTDVQDERLINPYFGMYRLEWPDEVNFQMPYGDWIRLFRRHGLLVEDLIETRPPEGAHSTYRSDADAAWARRWPLECIWKLRREAR